MGSPISFGRAQSPSKISNCKIRVSSPAPGNNHGSISRFTRRKCNELDADHYSAVQRWRWWKHSRRVLKKFNLGPIGNTIAGILGGVGGGQLLGMLTGAAAAGPVAPSGLDMTSI